MMLVYYTAMCWGSVPMFPKKADVEEIENSFSFGYNFPDRKE